MATLTQQQIDQLNLAAFRNNATDQANIAYAMKNFGYKPPSAQVAPAPVAPAPITPAPLPTTTSTGGKTLTPEQKAQLDLASTRMTPTDKANIDYATANFGYKAPVATPAVPAVPESVSGATVGTTPITPAPLPTDSTSTFMAGLNAWQKAQNEFLASSTANIDTISAERKTLADRLKTSMDELGGRAERTAALSAEAGIPESTKKLQDLNTQIATLTAQFDKGISAIENQDATGLSTTIAGKAGELRRQKAVEIGALASVAQALSGNIDLARQTIKDTVELEYQDKQAEVDALKAQLDLNYDEMTSAEKKKADQQKLFLDAKQDAIDEEKTTKTNVYNLALKAAENGADTATIQNITKSGSLDEAIRAAGTFVQSPKQDIAVQFAVDLMKKYPDAGITFTDTPEMIQLKLKNSAIYQKDAKSGSGSGSGTDTGTTAEKLAIQQELNGFRGTDGLYDPNKYRRLREDIAINRPKLLKWFDDLYGNYELGETGTGQIVEPAQSDVNLPEGLTIGAGGGTTETPWYQKVVNWFR
jgi:hypothetical protein